MKGVNEVGVWKCGILGSWNLLKMSELWQRIRSGWALHDMWCVFAINRDHRVLSVKALYSFC